MQVASYSATGLSLSSRRRHLVAEYMSTAEMPCTTIGELDNHAASNWDKFYLQNKTNFFKDRHYLAREFPELSSGKHIILEVRLVLFESGMKAAFPDGSYTYTLEQTATWPAPNAKHLYHRAHFKAWRLRVSLMWTFVCCFRLVAASETQRTHS